MDRDPATNHADLEWGLRFEQFSPEHLGAVLGSLFIAGAVIWFGLRERRRHGLRDDGTEAAGRLLGVIALSHWVVHQAWWWFPPRHGIDVLLPLHICDLAGLAAGVALVTGKRWATTLLYFWGIGLSTQAFVTPIVTEGPALARFWLFWESHVIIVGSAVYAVVVRGYRPEVKDLGVALGLTGVYVLALVPLNILLGSNYAYVGPPVEGMPRTLVDALGPWPWRIGGLMGVGTLAFVVIWAPWAIARRMGCAEAAESVRSP